MDRDFDKFPDDENGESLWHMLAQGDNLTISRDIDFSVIFRCEEDALKLANDLLVMRLKVSLADSEENDEFPFELIVHQMMEPTHESISKFEAVLLGSAKQYGGAGDGWGCYSQE